MSSSHPWILFLIPQTLRSSKAPGGDSGQLWAHLEQVHWEPDYPCCDIRLLPVALSPDLCSLWMLQGKKGEAGFLSLLQKMLGCWGPPKRLKI